MTEKNELLSQLVKIIDKIAEKKRIEGNVNFATLGRRFRYGMDLDVYGCGVYPHLPEYLIERG